MIPSLFTLGTAQLGMAYGLANRMGRLDKQQAFKVLDESVSQGVTSFDTAAAYGNSEDILGDYFYQNQGMEYEIITKLKPLVFDSETLENAAIQKTKESVELSLEKLKINSIPILMFHRYDDLIWQNHCLLNYLKSLKHVKKIGVSVYTPEQAIMAMSLDGISVIQLPTNLLDMRFIKQRVFESAKKKSIRIYIRSIYLQGLILMNADNVPSYLQEAKSFIIRLRKICNHHNVSLQELTIMFLKMIQGDNQIVIGCETAGQVRENAQLIISAPKMNQKIQAELFEEMTGISDYVINPSLWSNKK